MKKTGVFYGSSTGTCEELANQIAEKLGVSSNVILILSTTRVWKKWESIL